ncbi:TOX high mobility group box family member 3 [Thamnophis elegans]|uniref:TOX high mobility group box family member 3 n=1 Tax=Thamnophis elegans TaxID=35005 RepID=UPI001377CFE9|nr:TOX high mobility group box family member 3 [Thamnophis elegans]
MDVRFYPAASGNSLPGDPSSLDFTQCLGYYSYNKFGNNNYMNMAEANNAFFATNEQTFHTPSLGDEEFEIPPITPPPELDPTNLGMGDLLLPFQGLSDQLGGQGNEFTPQFPPQSLDLPSITVSRNLVEQDGIIQSNGLHMAFS